jgi:2-(1,2-epoxy-1,2-dihydrophenyl)acetyl-CoA isomerase
MGEARLRIERIGDVEVFGFTDAARLNPLTAELQEALLRELHRVEGDAAVRALVVTGEGRGFCVGADLGAISEPAPDGTSVGKRVGKLMRDVSNPLVAALQRSRVPVVAAVNGACAGAGVALALAADVAVMAKSAYLYLPSAPRLGLVPDLGSTWFLERAVGRSRAMAMALLDERLPAERAVQWGLAWSCVPDAALRQEAMALAQRLARLPSHSTKEMRAAFESASRNTLEEQMAYEAARQETLLELPSFAEGVRAFRERRRP